MTMHPIGHKNRLSFLSIGLVLTAFACGSNEEASGVATPDASSPVPSMTPAPIGPNPGGTGATTTARIDNATGATVALSNGTALVVPPGALPPGVDSITITSAVDPAPAEYAALSPAYVFGPEGTVFLKPLTVTLPFVRTAQTDVAQLTIFWSRSRGDGLDMLPTDFAPDPASPSVDSQIATTEVRHFSVGFVGLAFTEDPHPVADPYAGK